MRCQKSSEMFQISSLKIYFIYKSIELYLSRSPGGQKFKNQLKSKIRFLKKPDGWPGPARAFHVRASPHGPGFFSARAFFLPGLSKTAKGGLCANTTTEG